MRLHLILVAAAVVAGCHGGAPAAPPDGSPGGAGSTANVRWEPVTPATTAVSLTPPAAPAMPDGPAVPPFSSGGWTWEAPVPFGYDIADVWATSATDVIAAPRQRVFGQAALLGWNGSSWSLRQLPVGAAPVEQLSVGGGLLFARTSDGHVLRRKDGVFADLGAPIAAARIATPEDQDVWAFDTGGAVVTAAHWDGFTWTTSVIASAPAAHPDARAQVVSAWAGSPTDVWVSGLWPWGDNGAVMADQLVEHWDGVSWTAASTAVVDGSSPTGNYFGGPGGVSWFLLPSVYDHDSGSGWKRLTCSGGWWPILPVWADTTNGGFAAAVQNWNQHIWDATGVVRLDATGCTRSVPTLTRITALRAAADNDVWAFGSGEIAHFDGASWKHAGANAGFAPSALASSGGDVWAVDRNRIFHKGSGWTQEGSVDTGALFAIAVSPSGDVWAGGDARALYHLHAGQWSRVDLGAWSIRDITAAAEAVLVTATNNADSAVFRFSAGAWSMARIAGAHSAWGVSRDDLYVAADSLLHWNGTAFTTVQGISGASRVRGAGSDVWVTGSEGGRRVTGGAAADRFDDAIAVDAAAGGRAAIVRKTGAVTLYDNGSLRDLAPVSVDSVTPSVVLDGAHLWVTSRGVVRYDL